MNQIKRDIDHFIGNKPRFNQHVRDRIFTAIKYEKPGRQLNFLQLYFKYITVFSLLISVAAFLTFSYINNDVPTTILTNTTAENQISKIEVEQFENQLEAIENKEKVRKLAEQVSRDFLLAMSSNDIDTVKSLLFPGTVINDDFSIKFNNGSTYTKSTWNLNDNIVFTELNGYGFSDDSTNEKQIFHMFYQFTPKKEKAEDESYPIYVGIQLEFTNNQWLISQVWEDV